MLRTFWTDYLIHELFLIINQVPLARFVMMSTENDTTTFQFHSPQSGSFLLDLFAAMYPTFEQCLKEEPIKYVNICRFRLNCQKVEKVSESNFCLRR